MNILGRNWRFLPHNPPGILFMQLTKELEAEIKRVMETYWSSYLTGDINTWASYLAEDYKNIGTTEEEIWNSKKEIVDYSLSILHQLSGIAEVRHKTSQMIPIDPYIMVHEYGDLYLKSAKEWVFYSKIRMSTLLDQVNGTWMVLHQHGSYPDTHSTKGDTFGFDKLERENNELREAVQRRSIDLEIKNRELEIEASLERVRASTMAMQKSEELTDVAKILFQQVQGMGVPAWSCGFNIMEDEGESCMGWMSTEGALQPPFRIPLTESPVFIHFSESRKQGVEFYVEELAGEEIAAHYRYMKSLPEFGGILDQHIKTGFHLPTFQINHVVNFLQGNLIFITSEQVPHAWNIFKRFAKVFEQTYTRFLDLKKAEIQAREALIEASLEKVRSRSLAMQQPEELVEVAELLREEMGQLGVEELETSSIYIVDKENLQAECWYAIKDIREDGRKLVSDEMTITLTDTWVGGEMWNFYSSSDQMTSIVMKGAHRKEWINYCAERSQVLQGYYGTDIPERTYHLVKFSGGYMGAASPGDISAESWDLLVRVAAVFSFAYTRFRDLQDAAARAREAQIELALERVRSRSMAMHTSEELKEVIEIVYQQFIRLNVNIEHTGFIVDIKDSEDMHIWLADQFVSPFEVRIPYFDSPHWNNFLDATKTGTNFFVNHLNFEEKNRFYQDLFTLIPAMPEESRRSIFGKPGLAISTVLLKNVGLYIENLAGIPYTNEENAILMRFGKVFEQTYTRFLDLQKAEAQARESKIEAALESVRSKAMAMRTSEDIAETTAASFNELKKLGIFSFRSGVGILTKGSKMVQVFADARSTDGQLKALSTLRSMEEHPALQQQYEAWEQQKDYEQVLSGEALISYYSHPFYQNASIDSNEWKSGRQEYGHYFAFPDGLFYSWSYQPYTESEKKILHRFRNIIALTFRRYLDLQKAEAQAREAIKQTSLDRVRAVIASMRSADDLELITPLIFKELTILGVPFIRCGVFIINEGKENIEAYLSSPDGHSLGVLMLPYRASELTFQTVEAWRKGRIYKQHWNKEDFMTWTRQMMEQHQIVDSRTYQGTDAPPESLELNFVPFTQGMLYVGSIDTLGEKEIELVQSLASAFSIAYARYDDFVKLERAKTDIESALADLKATQSQLVQQEKLASLGQLTAGIAHEIKNPLNFVNNFSELNMELIQEAMDEIRKSGGLRDETLIDGILTDIQSNLQKVHEHGSRANGIVNSMLQHSRGGSGQLEPTNLNSFLKEYVHFCFQGMRAGKQPMPVEIEWDLSLDIVEIALIREDFSRVIVNICNNAFDAMRSKLGLVKPLNEQYEPLLTIHTKKDQSYVRLSFKDNGLGIPEDIKDKIMQPFFTTKKGTEGTGLGLSITHDIIKAHGGELRVETMVGEGSTFTIILPISIP